MTNEEKHAVTYSAGEMPAAATPSNDQVKFVRGKDANKPASTDVNTIFFASDTQIIYYKGIPYSVSGKFSDELKNNNIVTDIKFADPTVAGGTPSLVISYIKPDGTFVSGSAVPLFDVDSSKDNAIDTAYDSDANVYHINLSINSSDKILSQNADGLSAAVGLKKDGYVYTLVGKDGTTPLSSQTIDLSDLTKDRFVKSGDVVVMDTSFLPNIGDTSYLQPGTYLHLVLALDSSNAAGQEVDSSTNVYIAVDDLVETYTSGNGIDIDDNTPGTDGGVTISIKLDTTGDSSSYLSLSGSGLKLNSNRIWTDVDAALNALKTQVENDISTKVAAAKSTIDNYTVNSKKISSNPVLDSGDVAVGTVVTNVSDTSITGSDKLNTAIAKLQKEIQNGSGDTTALQQELDQLEKATVGQDDTSFGTAFDNTTYAKGIDSSVSSLAGAIVNVDAGISDSFTKHTVNAKKLSTNPVLDSTDIRTIDISSGALQSSDTIQKQIELINNSISWWDI